MNVLISILPLIFMLIVVVTLIFLVKWFSNWNVANKGYWMLGGYGLLLLIAVIVYYFIPVSAEENTGSNDPVYFNDVIYEGESIDQFREYLEKEWEFPYAEKSLYVQYQGDLDNALNIAVEQTDRELIEAAYYQTPVYVSGKDMSYHIQPLEVQLSSGNLVIELPESTYFEVTSFSKEFPLKQFTNPNHDDWWGGMDLQYGDQLLYLRIPKGIEIKSDSDVYFEYVNE